MRKLIVYLVQFLCLVLGLLAFLYTMASYSANYWLNQYIVKHKLPLEIQLEPALLPKILIKQARFKHQDKTVVLANAMFNLDLLSLLEKEARFSFDMPTLSIEQQQHAPLALNGHLNLLLTPQNVEGTAKRLKIELLSQSSLEMTSPLLDRGVYSGPVNLLLDSSAKIAFQLTLKPLRLSQIDVIGPIEVQQGTEQQNRYQFTIDKTDVDLNKQHAKLEGKIQGTLLSQSFTAGQHQVETLRDINLSTNLDITFDNGIISTTFQPQLRSPNLQLKIVAPVNDSATTAAIAENKQAKNNQANTYQIQNLNVPSPIQLEYDLNKNMFSTLQGELHSDSIKNIKAKQLEMNGLKLKFQNSDGQTAPLSINLHVDAVALQDSQLQGEDVTTDFKGTITEGYFQTSAKHFKYNRVDLDDAILDGQLLLSPELKVSNLNIHSKILEGKLAVEKAKYEQKATTNHLPIIVNNLNLQSLSKLFPQQGLSITGTLNGQIPLQLDANHKISINNTKLAASPEGGVIRYKIGDGSGDGNLDLALQALENFRYSAFNVHIKQDEEGYLNFLVHLKGSNPDFLEGKSFEFNINIEDHLPTLLKTFSSSSQINQKLESTVNQQETP